MSFPVRSQISNAGLIGNAGDYESIPNLPVNFGQVVPGIYRSAFPSVDNLPALKSIGVQTLLTLVDEPFTDDHVNFLRANGVYSVRYLLTPNKDANIITPEEVMHQALKVLMDSASHPVLVHCNKGKHRTGCVVALFRRLQGWDLKEVLAEYVKYSAPKSRDLDEVYIRQFDIGKLMPVAEAAGIRDW